MRTWFFASDLHGSVSRYESLFGAIESERPAVVLLGGDLLPHGFSMARAPGPAHGGDFIGDYLAGRLADLRQRLGTDYPSVAVILGNDDPRIEEAAVLEVATRGLWTYAHGRRLSVGGFTVVGYSYVPPTPFRLKDWEKYDVSRFVDPGCVSPEEGMRTIPVAQREARYATIREDLSRLFDPVPAERAVGLFHSPPYRTFLDRADLDGRTIDHVPLDVNVGSIAIERFIRRRQPRITLHGHVHESARLTGAWRDRIGSTHCLGAAHDGPELALVRFDPDRPADATRELVGEA
jgi:Icc-related predicted phosphoesterase